MIYAIPGMGADSTMYLGPWRKIPDCKFVHWPEYRGETTLDEVAVRLIDEHHITEGDTVIGCSLGGMVGCVISKLVRLRSLVLIGSAINKNEVSRVLAGLHPLTPVAPLELVQYAAGKSSWDLAQMFSRADPKFIRAMCRAIFTWNGLQSGLTPLRIHGRKDRIIPLPPQVDCILDGGHLISITHPTDCIAFLQSRAVLPPS